MPLASSVSSFTFMSRFPPTVEVLCFVYFPVLACAALVHSFFMSVSTCPCHRPFQAFTVQACQSPREGINNFNVLFLMLHGLEVLQVFRSSVSSSFMIGPEFLQYRALGFTYFCILVSSKIQNVFNIHMSSGIELVSFFSFFFSGLK
jgi:hypothetical protein